MTSPQGAAATRYRPVRGWAHTLVDLRTDAATHPFPLSKPPLQYAASPPPGSMTDPGWGLSHFVVGTAHLVLLTSPDRTRAGFIFDEPPESDDFEMMRSTHRAAPGIAGLILGERSFTVTASMPHHVALAEVVWGNVATVHAALVDPDRWLACRDEPLPVPGSPAEREALVEMVAWASAGATARWRVRRWRRYHVDTAGSLWAWRHWAHRCGLDGDPAVARIEAAAPYCRAYATQSGAGQAMSVQTVAAWHKMLPRVANSTRDRLHALGVGPRWAAVRVNELAGHGAWLAHLWKDRPNRLADEALVALALARGAGLDSAGAAAAVRAGMTAEQAAVAVRAGLSADEAVAAYTGGELDGPAFEGLKVIAGLRV